MDKELRAMVHKMVMGRRQSLEEQFNQLTESGIYLGYQIVNVTRKLGEQLKEIGERDRREIFLLNQQVYTSGIEGVKNTTNSICRGLYK